MGDCAFEETYRGLWMESTALEGDKQLSVGAYSLNMERLGRYDCLKLEESKRHRVGMCVCVCVCVHYRVGIYELFLYYFASVCF